MKLIALAILVSATGASAAGTAEGADQAVAKKEPRKICKRELTGTGLHSSRRVCLTAAEWKERNRNIDVNGDPRSKQVSY